MKHLGIYVALMFSMGSALFAMEQERLENSSIIEDSEPLEEGKESKDDIFATLLNEINSDPNSKLEFMYLTSKDNHDFRKEHYKRMKVAACILRAHPSFISEPLASSIIELQKEAAEFLIGSRSVFSVDATKGIHEFYSLRNIHKQSKKRDAQIEQLKTKNSTFDHEVEERHYHDQKLKLKEESAKYKKKKHAQQLKINEERLKVEQGLLEAQKRSNMVAQSQAGASELQARALQGIKEVQEAHLAVVDKGIGLKAEALNVARKQLYNADYQTEALQTIALEHQKQTALSEAQAASLDVMANAIAAELPEVSNGLLTLKLEMQKSLAYRQKIGAQQLDFAKAQQQWQQDMRQYKGDGQFGSFLYKSLSLFMNLFYLDSALRK